MSSIVIREELWSMVALPVAKLTTTWEIPGRSLSAPSTCETHDAQVMPCTGREMVAAASVDGFIIFSKELGAFPTYPLYDPRPPSPPAARRPGAPIPARLSGPFGAVPRCRKARDFSPMEVSEWWGITSREGGSLFETTISPLGPGRLSGDGHRGGRRLRLRCPREFGAPGRPGPGLPAGASGHDALGNARS